jgi:hypothetical protein
MRLVNMCLGSEMLYTRSTTIMTMRLEISMPMLEHQLAPLNLAQLPVVEPSPLKVVRRSVDTQVVCP